MEKQLNLLLLAFLGFLLLGCKREEKIPNERTRKQLEGTWYSDRIVRYDLLNNTSAETAIYYDSKPRVVSTPLDNMASQFSLYSDGTYLSLSHRLAVYFALVGNAKNADYKYAGTWQLQNDGNKIIFDKGIYEFDGSSSRYFDIALLTEDSLKLETTNPQAIYDWAYLLGQSTILIDLYPSIQNTCVGGGGFLGGKDFAALYGNDLGYRDATLDVDISYNPFGLGRRRGVVKSFNEIYKPQMAPIFDSCYQANLPSSYQLGFTNGSNLTTNVKARSAKLTFVFSRTQRTDD